MNPVPIKGQNRANAETPNSGTEINLCAVEVCLRGLVNRPPNNTIFRKGKGITDNITTNVERIGVLVEVVGRVDPIFKDVKIVRNLNNLQRGIQGTYLGTS